MGPASAAPCCKTGRAPPYLNAACVPRHGIDASGRPWRHFSWVELAANGEVQLAAHRWYGLEGAVLEQQVLLDSKGLVSLICCVVTSYAT